MKTYWNTGRNAEARELVSDGVRDVRDVCHAALVSDLERRRRDDDRPDGRPSGLAAIAVRNRFASRADGRVSKQRTDRVRELRRDSVLEFARRSLRSLNRRTEDVGDEALGEAMAPDDASRDCPAVFGE